MSVATPLQGTSGPYAGGPWVSNSGAVYLLGVTDATSEDIGIAKSIDPTTTALELAASQWTPGAGESVDSLWGHQVGDVLHVVAQTDAGRVAYRTFDFGTDTWGTAETVKTSITGFADAAVFGVVRSDGVVMVFYQSYDGVPRANPKYARRLTNGTWTVDQTVTTAADTNDWYPLGLVLGSLDRVHFLYSSLDSGTPDTYDLYQRTFTSGFVAHAELDVHNAANVSTIATLEKRLAPGLRFVDTDGVLQIRVPMLIVVDADTTEVRELAFASGNTPTINCSTLIIDTDVEMTGAAWPGLRYFRDTNNDRHVLFVRAANGDSDDNKVLVASKTSPAGWSANSDTGTTGTGSFTANRFRRGGNKVIAYCTQDPDSPGAFTYYEVSV